MTTLAPASMPDDDGDALDFTDKLLTEAQAAKVYGVSLVKFRELVRDGRGPWTHWSDDVRRGARAHAAGGPGRRVGR